MNDGNTDDIGSATTILPSIPIEQYYQATNDMMERISSSKDLLRILIKSNVKEIRMAVVARLEHDSLTGRLREFFESLSHESLLDAYEHLIERLYFHLEDKLAERLLVLYVQNSSINMMVRAINFALRCGKKAIAFDGIIDESKHCGYNEGLVRYGQGWQTGEAKNIYILLPQLRDAIAEELYIIDSAIASPFYRFNETTRKALMIMLIFCEEDQGGLNRINALIKKLKEDVIKSGDQKYTGLRAFAKNENLALLKTVADALKKSMIRAASLRRSMKKRGQ